MKFNLLILLTAGLTLSTCQSGKDRIAEEKSERPNVLFIMSDDHTSQAWGIYGGILRDLVKNDHIQRLADEGTILNNAFCTNSICVPSRGSILTGQYSHRNGIYTLSDAMHPDSTHIAKVLGANGYQTAIIGKWHLKKPPSGFDHFMVLPGQGVYHNPRLKTSEDWETNGKVYPGFSSDVITDYSLQWLDHRDSTKPFFLMTHFKATHEPFDFPERHKDLYRNVDIPEPESLYDSGPETTGRSFTGQTLEILGARYTRASVDSTFWTSYPDLPFSTEGLSPDDKRKKIYQKLVKDFMRCGAAIDDNIGRILDYLDNNGLTENTIVVYTADQGYFLGEHGFFDKRLIYEESLRMPFVIRYPKEIKAGARIDDIILNIDFPALFADYAGIPQPNFIQGKSFRNNLKGKTDPDWRTSMYYRYWLHRTERPGHFGIRNHRYKLALFYGQPLGSSGAMKQSTEPAWEFYDLQEDPAEVHNAINDQVYSDIIKEMKKELLALRNELGDTDKEYPEMQEVFSNYWPEAMNQKLSQ